MAEAVKCNEKLIVTLNLRRISPEDKGKELK
jgi:hypothetical protein